MTVYFLSKEEILKADDLETREVEVPEWAPPGVEHAVVRVRGLDGTARDAYEASMVEMREDNTMGPSLSNMKVKLVAKAIVDEAGNPMFNEFDIGALGQKSAIALGRVYEVVAQMSGLAPEAVTVAMGNSDGVPSAASTTS